MVSANIRYPDLIKRIQEKFAIDTSLQLKYKDEDGTMVTMIDQDDLEMVISMVPDSPTDTGRMEVNCCVFMNLIIKFEKIYLFKYIFFFIYRYG